MADCIIVGGGLIGMLTARELRLAGADPVVIEKAALGGESTWAGGGILSPLYPWRYDDSVNALAKRSQALYPEIATELYHESGIDPEYNRSGLLVLDAGEEQAAKAWAGQWSMDLQMLDQNRLMATEPVLNVAYRQGMLMPDIAQLRNPRLAKALRGSMTYYDIPCHEYTPVTGLNISDGRVVGVRTPQQDFNADRVIVAGGAWSAGIIQQYAKAPAIEPVKGQMIIFKGAPGLVDHIILYKGHYIIPRRDGRILAGSTLEHTAFDKKVTEVALRELTAAATDLVPALGELQVEHHWSGLRPGTSSGIPYICEHPDISGLFVNSGHFRNGVILGAASAQLLVEMISGQALTLDAEPYMFYKDH